MTRKDFLLKLWDSVFKPILYIIAGIIAIKILYNIFIENGINLYLFILLIFIVLGLTYLQFATQLIGEKLKKIFPNNSNKSWLTAQVVDKTFQYLIYIFSGVLLHISWQKDPTFTLIFFSFHLIGFISNTIKKHKENIF